MGETMPSIFSNIWQSYTSKTVGPPNSLRMFPLLINGTKWAPHDLPPEDHDAAGDGLQEEHQQDEGGGACGQRGNGADGKRIPKPPWNHEITKKSDCARFQTGTVLGVRKTPAMKASTILKKGAFSVRHIQQHSALVRCK